MNGAHHSMLSLIGKYKLSTQGCSLLSIIDNQYSMIGKMLVVNIEMYGVIHWMSI